MKLLGLLICVACVACEGGKGGGIPPVDGGSGISCGGFKGTQCPADEFCDFGRNSCGATDETGTCRTRPLGCPDIFQPTCGCDGVTHGNACEANAAGVDVSDLGNCPAQAGQFGCGHTFCNLDSQYCQRAGSDIGGEPDGFQCNELPAACGGTPSCACLASEPCGDLCEGTANEGFEVTCLGG